jgi:Subtilase family
LQKYKSCDKIKIIKQKINMKNKNIWKKSVILGLLASTILFSFGSTLSNLSKNITQKPSTVRLEESDKIKLNKKLSPIGFSSSLKVNAAADEIKDPVVVGELLVKFKNISEKESFIKENVGESAINTSLVTKITTSDVDEAETLDTLNLLKNDSRIEWAEPNIQIRRSFVPNDTKYNDQWYLKNTGQSALAFYNPFPTITYPTPGFDIKAEQAWDVSTGNGTVIAIIDDGLDYNHPDLAPNIFRDSGGRIIGKNIGDNCLYSNLNGTDNTSCNYQNIPADSSYGHGTAVAGVAAAKGNNTSGISGACPNCKIMPIGLEGIVGPATINSSTLYDGMVYAMNNGAKIINMSLGFDTYLNSIAMLVNQAYNSNILIVASSGNCGLPNPNPALGCTTQNQLEYPASFPEAISVSATSPNGIKANFATVNSSVDISAPGRNIWTTWSQYTTANCGSSLILSGGSYLCYEDGTSFSSPMTAGVLGLIIGQNPTYTYSQAETALKNGTTNTYTLNPSFVGLMGAGDLNACGALVGCNINSTSSSSTISSSLSSSAQSITNGGNININLCQGSTNSTVLSLTANSLSNNLNLVSQTVPSGISYSTNNTTGNLNISYTPNAATVANLGQIAGTYNLVIQESNNLGNVGAPKQYNLIFNVNNCSSSVVSSSIISSSVSSLPASSSVVSSSSTQVSSSPASSSVISSSVISSSVSSSAPLSFGSFLPNATLNGVVGSIFPSFTLNGCNLGLGSTPVTISTGISSITGTITNCIFTPNAGQNILPAFQTVSTLTLASVGVASLTIPIAFTLQTSSSSVISSSSTQASSSILSSSVVSSSIISSSVSSSPASSSVVSSSAISSSVISSSVISSSVSSVAPLSFGSFLPNATLNGVVGSIFPSFTLNGCNLGLGSTPVTISTGSSSITGTITNCIFTPNAGQNILPAFSVVSTFTAVTALTLASAGVPSLTIPVYFYSNGGNVNINLCQGSTNSTVLTVIPKNPSNYSGIVSDYVPSGIGYYSGYQTGNLDITYYPDSAPFTNLGQIPGFYPLIVNEGVDSLDFGVTTQYNQIFTVINCSSSLASSSSAQVSSSALSSSVISSSVDSSSSTISSLIASSSVASSSVISSSVSSSAPLSFGSFLPNGTLTGVVGSIFPGFTLNGCNLGLGSKTATISTGINSITGTITNCIFTPNAGQNILPAFQTVSTLTLASAGVASLTIPVAFTLQTSSSSVISSSSAQISSSILSSSVLSSSIISSSVSSSPASSSAQVSSSSSTGVAVSQGGAITISNQLKSSSSLSTLSKNSEQFSSSKSEVKLDTKNEFGDKNGIMYAKFEGEGECSQPIETQVKTAKEQNIKDTNNLYPFGVFSFKVKCDSSVKVKISYPTIKDWKEWKLRKLIFNKQNLTYNWQDYAAELGFENGIATITYTIKDGEYGDSTAKDGYIIDPIGLVKVTADNTSKSSLQDQAKEAIKDPLQFILPRTGGINIANLTFVILFFTTILALFAIKTKRTKE